MPATKADFTDVQGDTLRIRFPLDDAAGDPLVFDGITIRADVKQRNPTDDSPVLESFAVESTEPGAMTLRLTATQTAGFVGTFAYDVVLTTADGEVDTPFEGEITWIQKVSKDAS